MNENTPSPGTAVIEGVFDLARDGRTGPLGEMIDAGFGLDTLNARGDTLLIVAAYLEHVPTVTELLRRGADTSVLNAMGQTAISCAVFRNNETILHLLLRAEADPRLGTHSGIAIAEQFGLPHLREIIESYSR